MRALFCCGVAAAAMRMPLRHPQMAILTTADLPSHAQSPQGFDAFPFAYHEELTLQIESLTNMGDGVARVELDADSRWVVFVPYVLPGELVRARVYRNDRGHSRADLLKVLKPSAARVKPACSLFGVCGGCQYQHLEYSEQLSWKRQQVSDFLTRIGGLDPTLVNGVLQPTQGSPKQLHYRSKITPHWSVPKAVYDDDNDDFHAIGFLATTNRSKMVDVSACALATDKINAALPAARERLRESLKRGAKRREARTGTLLLRDVKEGIVTEEDAEVTEVVNGLTMRFRAGEFFQTNPFLLPSLVEYVVSEARGSGGASSDDDSHGDASGDDSNDGGGDVTHLIDTYSGCGLFALSAAQHFNECIGIEVSPRQVELATRNAEANEMTNVKFTAGSAECIFDSVAFDGKHAAVVVDPPRRGCDAPFLSQLIKYAPKRIVYVSCSPDTQARDLKTLVASGYSLSKLTPFDLFPHTRHVEAVATLEWLGEGEPSPVLPADVAKAAKAAGSKAKGRKRRRR